MQAAGAGEVAAEARSSRRAPPAPEAPAWDRDPAPGASKLESRSHMLLIGKELTTSGSTLDVRWTTRDMRLLRVSVLSFLEQLTLVVQTMQRFGPPVSR